jgi:hypothetical protein
VEYRIVEVEGDAGLIPQGSGEASPPVDGMTVLPGDRIVTGAKGRVQLAAQAGNVIELGEKSSLEIQNLSPEDNSFFLRVGRLLAKFSKFVESAADTRPMYNIHTPVSVAAVRGTELVVDVQESGETQTGVVEGEISVWEEDEEQPASEDKPAAEEIVVKEGTGLRLARHERPKKWDRIPPPLADSVAVFPRIRRRVPELRARWKAMDRPERLRLRQRMLRERIRWQVPSRRPRLIPARPVPHRAAPRRHRLKERRRRDR